MVCDIAQLVRAVGTDARTAGVPVGFSHTADHRSMLDSERGPCRHSCTMLQ